MKLCCIILYYHVGNRSQVSIRMQLEALKMNGFSLNILWCQRLKTAWAENPPEESRMKTVNPIEVVPVVVFRVVLSRS